MMCLNNFAIRKDVYKEYYNGQILITKGYNLSM